MLKRIKKINKKICDLHAEAREIRTACPHPEKHRTYSHYFDTGNWDTTQDSEETKYNCNRCGKCWWVDGIERVGTEEDD